MPVVSQTATLVAFPAARVRRLPARPAPTRASSTFVPRDLAEPAAFGTSGVAMRAAMGAGLGAVLLACAGLGGWGFVQAERGVQASLAGYATSSAPAAGGGTSTDLAGRAASSMAWDRR